MAFEWTWLGAYQTGVTVFSFAVAGAILAARPDRFQNRSLAAVLVLFGLMGFGSQGLIQLTDDRGLALASQTLLFSLGAAVSFVYLAFVGTLPTPLARPFSGLGVRRMLLAMAAAWALVAALSMDVFVAGFVRSPSSAVWSPVHRDAAIHLFYVVAAAVLYGFLAAVSVLRRAPAGGPLRQQALIYAAAFGIRDAWYIAAILALPLGRASPELGELILYQFPSLTLFVTALLGYGILRYQMFDFDLKLKWTLRRGTVAAILLGVFFVASELAQVVLSEVVGTIVGILAAGLLVVAIAPLQRAADKLADRALPGVRDTAEYRTVRKREVYQAAVESALQDGVITEKERDVLATLAEKLALGPVEARAVERDVLAQARRVA